MVCSSLPNFNSTTSPSDRSSAPESAKACSEASCRFGSEGAKRRIATPMEGPEPSGNLCEYVARKTESGSPSP